MSGTILGKGINRGTKIYRTLSKDRLLQMFADGKNALVRPKKWQDTFENYLLNAPVVTSGVTATLSFAKDLYGQCWTLQGFSDAMWRIYASDKQGVRIRSTVGKLLDSLAASDPKHSKISCFIGAVHYCTDRKLDEFAANHFRLGLGTDGKKIASSLLIKRNAFKHEKEVRLIYLSPSDTDPKNDFYSYSFDCHGIIDQIMLHPQLDKDKAARLRKRIERETKFKGSIVQSMLYRLPKGFVVKIGP